MTKAAKFDLLPRLISFSVRCSKYALLIPDNPLNDPWRSQLLRASVSVSLNYSEALSAESRKDFIHKLSIASKELRECNTCLLLSLQLWINNPETSEAQTILKEADELQAILTRSIQTAKANQLKNKE
jgi:four helix bundle protein